MIRRASIVSRVEKHTTKALELKERDLSDEIVFNAAAMHCFQAVNAGIELGEVIISEMKLGFPSKYKEIFELIFQAKLINKKMLEDMKRLVFLRNLIAHEYYAIVLDEIREMISLLGSLDGLVAAGKKRK